MNMWTEKSLIEKIVKPLITPLLEKQHNQIEIVTALTFLLTAYREFEASKLVDRVSVRDLQNLISRWVFRAQRQGQNFFISLAYSACMDEWSHRIMDPQKREKFLNKLSEMAASVPTELAKKQIKWSFNFVPLGIV